MSIWVMIIISGLLCTQIANPLIIFRLLKGIIVSIIEAIKNKREYDKKLQTAIKDKSVDTSKIKKAKVSYMDAFNLTTDGIIGFLILQIVCFLIGGISLGLWYYFAAVDRTLLAMFATWWLAAIIHAINSGIAHEADMLDLMGDDSHSAITIVYVGLMFVLPIALNIYSDVYNFNNPVEPHTYFYEEEIPVVDTDVWQTLEKETIVDGYTLETPIIRHGKTIIPLSRNDNVSIIGYVLIEDNKPIVVQKKLTYTPYQPVNTNVEFIAREYLPTKVFFGNWTFQIDHDGEVYFAKMYGKFASLRAGRLVEGMLLVNATTGECSEYKLKQVPEWVSGIAE